MKERDFNSAAKIFLGLSMVVTVITIINSIMSLRISKYTGTSTATIIAEIAVDFLILVAAVLTFQKKRYGLIGLVALFIIRVFISLPAAGNISASYVLGGNTAILLRDFGPFAIAMFFKKNGISGWKSMLASMKNEQDGDGPEITDEQNDLQNAPSNDGELSPTSTSKMVADIKVSEPMISDKSERAEFVETGTPTVNDTISSEDSVPQEHNRMSLKQRLTSLPKSIKYGCIALTVLLIVFGIIAIVVSSKKYPEYISSFADKWKYSFNQPNNKLASSYFQKAMATRNPGDFYFDDGDESFWMRNSSYYSLESTYRERYKDVDVYAMKDTIKAKIEIDTTAKYIVRWHDSYQFGIGSGTVAMKRYDGWIEEDPEIVIIRVEKFDMNQAHEKEVEYMSYASLISTSNVDLTNQIANYYEADKNYNKSADIYSQALKFNKKSPFLLARLAYSQYLNGEASDAKINAEKALTIDPKETCALEVFVSSKLMISIGERQRNGQRRLLIMGQLLPVHIMCMPRHYISRMRRKQLKNFITEHTILTMSLR